MAYVPPTYPQRITVENTTMTQEDQRLFVMGENEITADMPDPKESFEKSRRFGLYNKSSVTAKLRGLIEGEMKTVDVPVNMFREFVAAPDDLVDGQPQTYSFMVTPAQKDDTRGIHIQDDKGNRVANARTIIVAGTTVSPTNGSGATITPDPITGATDA